MFVHPDCVAPNVILLAEADTIIVTDTLLADGPDQESLPAKVWKSFMKIERNQQARPCNVKSAAIPFSLQGKEP